MATTTYTYAQITPGFSGYFDYTDDPTRRCLQPNSLLFLYLTGTSATIKCGGGGASPYTVTVDGVESTPVISAGQMTLFTGLADVKHTVSVVVNPGYSQYGNWITTNADPTLSVTGASPAMSTVPMEFNTWTTFPGKSTIFTRPAPGSTITPATERQVYDDVYGLGTVSFKAACDTIYVFAGDSPLLYSIDDGAPVQVSVTASATTVRHLSLLAAGLNTGLHKYTIWQVNANGETQGVACLLGGSVVSILPITSGTKTLTQFGDSITQGVGATAGAVETFQVGRSLGYAVAKWGVAGQTTSQLAALVPTYFTHCSPPDYLLLAIGRNDNGNLALQADYTACLQAFITAGCTKIICRGILPNGSELWPTENAAIQAAIASFASKYIVFMNTSTWSGIDYADGVHPTAAGYIQMAAYETPVLQAIIAAMSPSTSKGWCPGFYPGWGQN